jgi:hypothetical protein
MAPAQVKQEQVAGVPPDKGRGHHQGELEITQVGADPSQNQDGLAFHQGPEQDRQVAVFPD